MLHRRFPSVRVGVFLACLDGCVIMAAAVFMGARAALYALIDIVITAYVIDQVLSGTGTAKA
ncbi:MAG: YitT family protein, partial [Treponema sp.]|nr:YitT family protein [Treponema sp.]